MAKASNGLAPLPAGLLRPTTPPPETAEVETEAHETNEGQGGSAAVGSIKAAPAKGKRTRRAVVAGETKGRKLQLPDDIHDRLWMLARQKRTSVSAVAAEILDRNLPRWRVEREG